MSCFITPDWAQPPHQVGYDNKLSANPFETFEQIPARSRYQWLLDNAALYHHDLYSGPVCKGQVALNVIDDHFWIMFMDPDYDLAVKYPGFLKLTSRICACQVKAAATIALEKSLFDNHPLCLGG